MDKLKNSAKSCLYRKTKAGIITKIYSHQKESSIRRGHNLPNYSKKEFIIWMNSQYNFNLLFEERIKSGYNKDYKPSVDRIDDTKGYSFDNIKLTNWLNNNNKQYISRRLGLDNIARPIYGINLTTKQRNDFISITSASINTGVNRTSIIANLKGRYKQAGGYRWFYLNN